MIKVVALLLFVLVSLIYIFSWAPPREEGKRRYEIYSEQQREEKLGGFGNYRFHVNGYYLVMSEKQKKTIKNNFHFIKPGITRYEVLKHFGQPTSYSSPIYENRGNFGAYCHYDIYKKFKYNESLKCDRYINFQFGTDDKLKKITTNVKEFKLKEWKKPFFNKRFVLLPLESSDK